MNLVVLEASGRQSTRGLLTYKDDVFEGRSTSVNFPTVRDCGFINKNLQRKHSSIQLSGFSPYRRTSPNHCWDLLVFISLRPRIFFMTNYGNLLMLGKVTKLRGPSSSFGNHSQDFVGLKCEMRT